MNLDTGQVTDIGLDEQLWAPAPQEGPPSLDLKMTVEPGRPGPAETRRVTVSHGGRAWVFDVVIAYAGDGDWRAYAAVLNDRANTETVHVDAGDLAVPSTTANEIAAAVVNRYFDRHPEKMTLETCASVHVPNFTRRTGNSVHEIVLLAYEGDFHSALIRRTDGTADHDDWSRITFDVKYGGYRVRNLLLEEETGCRSENAYHVDVTSACEQAVEQHESCPAVTAIVQSLGVGGDARVRNLDRACAHCGREKCADHCPADPDGEHDPRVEGPPHLSYHGGDATVFDREVVCDTCGAQGHTVFVVGMDDPDDDLLDDVRWDWPGGVDDNGPTSHLPRVDGAA